MSNMILNKNLVKILGSFSDDYNKRIYGRDISKKLRINQKTISNLLNKLEKDNILKFSIEGKNKYYYFNKFNPNIRDIIKLIEIQRKIEFFERYKKYRELFDKLDKRAKGILIIFGSYADFSANKKSDLDVFVIGKIDDIKDLEQLYNIKLNIVKINEKDFNKEAIIVKEIIKKHIILKGEDEFIRLIW